MLSARRATLSAAEPRRDRCGDRQCALLSPQRRPQTRAVETTPGVLCRQIWRANETCSLYVSGWLRPLVSTLIMLACARRCRGCPIACWSARRTKRETHPAIIVAAACGVEATADRRRAGDCALTFGAGAGEGGKIFGLATPTCDGGETLPPRFSRAVRRLICPRGRVSWPLSRMRAPTLHSWRRIC